MFVFLVENVRIFVIVFKSEKLEVKYIVLRQSCISDVFVFLVDKFRMFIFVFKVM